MNLFVIYIGGTHKNALIELHDMRFIIAETIEDTYDILRKSWWGVPESLHLDCWGILRNVGGYHIHLRDTPALDENKLYFVNLGGYDSAEFTELHKNIFVVAFDPAEAKIKALAHIPDWKLRHKDYLYEADHIINIQALVSGQNLHIHLEKSMHTLPFEFTCNYIPLGKTL